MQGTFSATKQKPLPQTASLILIQKRVLYNVGNTLLQRVAQRADFPRGSLLHRSRASVMVEALQGRTSSTVELGQGRGRPLSNTKSGSPYFHECTVLMITELFAGESYLLDHNHLLVQSYVSVQIFIFENNIYYCAHVGKQAIRVVSTGKDKVIFNGLSDWLYEGRMGSYKSTAGP